MSCCETIRECTTDMKVQDLEARALAWGLGLALALSLYVRAAL